MTTNHDAPHENPFVLFGEWLALAEQSEPNDPNACAVATVSPHGMPSNRMVLCKSYDENGFVFYTNAHSRKGQHMAHNQNVAMLFHWKSLRKQIRIEGTVTPVSPEQSDEYFKTRSVISQFGAVASDQSAPLPNKQTLIDRVAELEQTHTAQTLPRPDHWHGYRLAPQLIEFWTDGTHRLHDRWNYIPNANGGWDIQRLYP